MIIGLLIRMLTFPGVMLDALINKKTCQFLNIELYQVNYFSIAGEELPVIHEIPKEYSKTFGIAIYPFVIMSMIAIAVFYIGNYLFPSIEFIFIWLGISVAAHSFPNTVMGDLLWKSSISEIKGGNYLAIIGIPLVAIIYLARMLHFFWLDIIYGVILYILIIRDGAI
ncbi:hypothetical protein [Psychroserpens ponticola]|uniref:HXXEE domain-containing protein n=1 Tax=Psychroserpens ponticola TaxID=2932268 RepID=A0ABY7RVI2_9FLAO|nr:hypothetical protein [Psychroserpens ponticola]WCO00711.1 hypothetical protein MUN68_011605 [Psychroserpens ponticola]